MDRTQFRRALFAGVLVVASSGLLSAALGGCRTRADSTLRPTRGVLVISLDTLRADHLSAYGYSRDTSPFLDALARRGVLFEQVIAQYPSTLTSHMCVFTGLYPGEHGVYPPDAVLSERIPTLPELFRAGGYRTGGFTEGGFVAGRFGFARGFDTFDDRARRKPDDVERTLARARAFVEGIGPEERYFLFVHSYQIHDPYDPPEPYASMFRDGEPPDTFPPDAAHLVRHNTYGGELPAGTVEYFEALYDGSIRYADDQLAEFFAFLEERGLTDDLTVVVLSDHGEQFQEHGQFVHADIYYETMHVPLVVVHPGLPAGRRVGRPVELLDVAPTLLDLAGIDADVSMSGRSRIPEMLGAGGSGGAATAYAENDLGQSRSFYMERDRSLHHVVVHHRPLGDWNGRRVTLDLAPDVGSVRLQGWRTPHAATLSLEGGWSRDVEVPAEPRDRAFAVPAGDRRRLTVTAHDCTPREGRQNACFAFRVLEPETTLTELFEVSGDPLEQHDLARQRPEEAAELRRRVMAVHHDPRAEPAIRRLERSLERRLRALGYL